MYEGESQTHVLTTDVSQPVRKKHRQNDRVGQVDIPTRVESM